MQVCTQLFEIFNKLNFFPFKCTSNAHTLFMETTIHWFLGNMLPGITWKYRLVINIKRWIDRYGQSDYWEQYCTTGHTESDYGWGCFRPTGNYHPSGLKIANSDYFDVVIQLITKIFTEEPYLSKFTNREQVWFLMALEIFTKESSNFEEGARPCKGPVPPLQSSRYSWNLKWRYALVFKIIMTNWAQPPEGGFDFKETHIQNLNYCLDEHEISQLVLIQDCRQSWKFEMKMGLRQRCVVSP